jgi:integrase/recombinase XerC
MIEEHCKHMKRRGLAPATIAARRSKLVGFDKRVGLAAATAEDVEVFLDGRKLAPKSRYDWISHLSSFYRWAIDHGRLDRDPTVQVIRPRLHQNLPRPIGSGDLVTSLQMAEPMMRAWLSLMAFGGLRCVEVARLEVDDLLWEDRLIRVSGKGDKERMVPMHDEIARCLRSLRLPSRGRVFRRPRGGAYPPAQVSKEVATYLCDLGVSATAHQLRHWFGTHVYRACRDLRVVQELMGHSSPVTTAGYADWSKIEARRAIDDLALQVEPSVLSDWSSS